MLPVPLTSLVGREHEEAQVAHLLGRARLLTLTGPGGVGKTRLALTVAGSRATCRDGAWLVELASLSDPELILSAVRAALRLHEEPERPLLQTVTDYLENKQLLLVLDNCEHLVRACAALASAMLRRCPALRILATSREGLGVPGEQLYRVPGLAVPDPVARGSLADLEQVEAVRLFVARARERRADFTLTAQNADAVALVCARLEGLPLAIELAGGRVGSLPLEAIAAQLQQSMRLLGGGPRAGAARQQTMQAALDWSWDLLDGSERTLLGRLSVFAGGWVLEAAGRVCGEDGQDAWKVTELLAALVGKSLVVLEEGAESQGRYRLLEPVRQYAAERLAEASEEGRVRERHLAWGVALAEEAAVQLRGPERAVWLARLDAEHDNLRAALTRSLEGGHVTLSFRLGLALVGFWYVRGHLAEGRGWLEALVTQDPGRSPSGAEASTGDPAAADAIAMRAEALQRAGTIAFRQGDYDHVVSLSEASIALFRLVDDKRGTAAALNDLGNVASDRGDYAQAAALYEESLALFRVVGDERGISIGLNNLGLAVMQQGEYGRATALQEEALVVKRKLGDSLSVAASLINLGKIAVAQGDYGRAGAHYHESLVLLGSGGDKTDQAESLEGLGVVAYGQGNPWRAVRLFGAAAVLREAIGAPLPLSDRLVYERAVAGTRAALGDDFDAVIEAGRLLTSSEAVAEALDDRPEGASG